MKNIILISLDTLRADVAYSGQFPGIEKLRERGVSFLNTVSSAPLTPISHATILSGLQPYNHGIRHLFKEKIHDDVDTLGAMLKRSGYQTGAIVSCPGMNSWYGFSKGFDLYDDEIPLLPDGTDPLKTVDVKLRGQALKRAPVVVERAQQWLNTIDTDKPFALLIHFFDAHWPYEAPEIFGGQNIYEEEVAYSDHYLHSFMDNLKEKGLLDNTLIVCFSDHGEDLEGLYENDKGGERNGHPEEFGHGNLLYEQTQKVPLIFCDNTLPQGVNIDTQVRLVDVTPTIVSLLGIPVNANFDGVDLSPVIKGTPLDLVGYSETRYPEEQNEATNNKYPDSRNKTALVFSNDEKIIIHEGIPHEYFKLTSDPLEKKNLL